MAKKSTPNPFAFLKPVNDWLEGVPRTVTDALDNIVGSGEDIAQSYVDNACIWLSCKVNRSIERVRRGVQKTLYGIYQSVTNQGAGKAAKSVEKFASDPIGAIGDLASLLFAPVVAIYNIVKFLFKEIPRLAENLAKIVNALPPQPPSPHINYDKFQVKVMPISLAMITTDPDTLPPIEVMYPEPEKPLFSPDDFEKEFMEAVAGLKSSQVLYTLKESDKESLDAVIRAETSYNPEETQE